MKGKQEFNILAFDATEEDVRPRSSRNRTSVLAATSPSELPAGDDPPRKTGRGGANVSGSNYNIVNFVDNGKIAPVSPNRGKKIFQQTEKDLSFQSQRAYQGHVENQDLDEQRVNRKIDALHDQEALSASTVTIPVADVAASDPPAVMRAPTVHTSVRMSRRDERNYNIITGQ